MDLQLRPEREQDYRAIAEVVRLAFLDHPHSDGSEPRIVASLRARGDISVSLVAEVAGQVVGHVAFSRVVLNPSHDGWHGLGPLAVSPVLHRQGIGSHLVNHGLAELRSRGAVGCVVFGNPAYHGRFGFASFDHFSYAGGPPTHFMALALQGTVPRAAVTYSSAFCDA